MFDLEGGAAKRKEFRQSEGAAPWISGKCGREALQDANHGNLLTVVTGSDALSRPRFFRPGLAPYCF